ncbi:hypothetical protein GCM10022249_03700 [Enteractinococcus coprophilus]
MVNGWIGTQRIDTQGAGATLPEEFGKVYLYIWVTLAQRGMKVLIPTGRKAYDARQLIRNMREIFEPDELLGCCCGGKLQDYCGPLEEREI